MKRYRAAATLATKTAGPCVYQNSESGGRGALPPRPPAQYDLSSAQYGATPYK